MYKPLRVMIAILVVLGIVLLARDQAVWAQPGNEAGPRGQAQEVSSSPLTGVNNGGTVKPPARNIKICRNGVYSLGGVSVFRVWELAPHYCLKATLVKRNRAPGRVPEGAGRILADVTRLQIYYRNRPVDVLPEEDGLVEICYAVPPGKDAKIYFKSRLGEQTFWRPLATTVTNGVACARAQVSGYYALIGK